MLVFFFIPSNADICQMKDKCINGKVNENGNVREGIPEKFPFCALLKSLTGIFCSLKNHTDSRVARDSLATLASLCHNNYVVVKMISNRLTDDERKSLFIQNSSRTGKCGLV